MVLIIIFIYLFIFVCLLLIYLLFRSILIIVHQILGDDMVMTRLMEKIKNLKNVQKRKEKI